MNFSSFVDLLSKHLADLDQWRDEFGKPVIEDNRLFFDSVLSELVQKLKGNYPFHHPSYAGQMLKPPHPLAWLAYTLTATINPNNHALDGGPPTSAMEKEVVHHLAEMVGYNDFIGHLTASGTTANLEALWIIKQTLAKGKKLVFSENAHYTHERISTVLGIPFFKYPCDINGLPDWEFLSNHKSEIGAIVVTMGTTGLGIVEPLTDIFEFFADSPVWIHADAAYGGFYKIVAEKLPSDEQWKYLSQADSIVIDPHKHGLQPYGCGAVLFSDPKIQRFYKHDSPYTYFSSDELHLGEISLECSRAGAAAAAFWATLKMFPLNFSGLGKVLCDCREAALRFAQQIEANGNFRLYQKPDLDIVSYFPFFENSFRTSEISDLSKKIFRFGMEAPPNEGFHLSLFTVNSKLFKQKFPEVDANSEKTVILRSVLMKPEHLDFIPELVKRLNRAMKHLV